MAWKDRVVDVPIEKNKTYKNVERKDFFSRNSSFIRSLFRR